MDFCRKTHADPVKLGTLRPGAVCTVTIDTPLVLMVVNHETSDDNYTQVVLSGAVPGDLLDLCPETEVIPIKTKLVEI